jgi:hypothetical protein
MPNRSPKLITLFTRASPEPRTSVAIRNLLFLFTLKDCYPASKLPAGSQLLAAARDFLLNIFAATLHIYKPSPPFAKPEDAPCHGNKGPTLPW